MLPLNKPLISKKRTEKNLNSFFLSKYPGKSCYLTFSARQGLSLIYSELFQKYGNCKVAVSPLTCFEAIYPIVHSGHTPMFIDIDPETLNMDISKLDDTVNVIQCIHLGGNPQEIPEKADKRIVIEDCAQAYGSKKNGIDAGMYGNYSAFSFLKNLNAIGGGFVVSDTPLDIKKNSKAGLSATIYRILKNQLEAGLTYKTGIKSFLYSFLLKLKPENSGSTIQNLSLNKYFIRSIQKQLAIEEELIENRIKNANYILKNIDKVKFTPQKINKDDKCCFTRLFFISEIGDSINIIQFLRSKGIAVNHLSQNYLHYFQNPVFKEPLLKEFYTMNLPNYQIIHDRILALPVSPALSLKEMDYIIKTVNSL